jgi:hypothetical protein
MRALAATIGVILLTIAGQLNAEPNSADALSQLDKGDTNVALILYGYATGYGWANAELRYDNKPRLYCEPEEFIPTIDQNILILREFIKRHPTYAQAPAGLGLLEAYKEMFPCT